MRSERLVSLKQLAASVLVSTLTCALLSIPAIARAEKLTLDESIDIALQNNPVLSIAAENVKKANAMVDEARVPGRPTLRVESSYARLDKVPVTTIGNGAPVAISGIYNRSADLIMEKNIDAFGVVRTGKRAAELGKIAYERGYAQQVNDTTLDVKTAYYNVLRANEFQQVAEDTVAMLEAHVAEANKNLKAGTIPRFEVLRAETELANVQQGLISAKNGVALASAAFNNALGRDLDTPVDLADPGKPQLVDVKLAQCLDSACNSRPEVLRADAQVAYSATMTKLAKLGNRPKLSFGWDYTRNIDPTIFDPLGSSWRALISGSIPLYDGGATRAATKRAESDERNARSMKEQAVQGVMLDAQQAYLSLQESQARIDAASKALDEAKESKRLAELRYKGGVATQVEVLDAQTALTMARTNYVNAEYDYQVALAKLEHAVGGRTQMARLIESTGEKTAAK